MAIAANIGIARQLGKTARKRDRTLDVVVMASPIQTLRLGSLVQPACDGGTIAAHRSSPSPAGESIGISY